jgi:hypothetical protein
MSSVARGIGTSLATGKPCSVMTTAPPGIYLIHEGETPPFEYTYRQGFDLIRLQDYRHYTTIISSRLPGLA